MKKTLLCAILFGCFLYGIGLSGLTPFFQMFRDTQWSLSLFPVLAFQKIMALLWLVPILLGLLGWAQWIGMAVGGQRQKPLRRLTDLSVALAFFSFYCLALGLNELLYPGLIALFFLPAVWQGWKAWCELRVGPAKFGGWILFLPVALLWGSEYLSSALVWDAVLDHFRFAEEVARLHQLPFHWVNHTGDIPKFAEMILAGFWSLGGESLAKLSSAIPALLTAWLMTVAAKELKFEERVGQWIFWTCPLFLALFAWGYVEGFLAFYEILATYSLWRFLEEPKKRSGLAFCVFFFGVAFTIKYTAIFAIVAGDAFLIYQGFRNKHWGLKRGRLILLLFLPILPWALRNELANGNPIYPLATAWLGGPPGYNPGMESNLWQDTGKAFGLNVMAWPRLLWDSFFTTGNGVAAACTPLIFMSLPWWGLLWKERFARYWMVFGGLFFFGWLLFCTDLRHAAGGVLVLVFLSAWAWTKALEAKNRWNFWLLGLGILCSLWLCFCTQLVSTSPYASALGLENPLERLKRNYSFNLDTYAAYRDIEKNSSPLDKVLTLGVFQTYPLHRTAFVDFYWKRPILLTWASQCRTAEDLALKLKEEGVGFILYQREEAIRSFGRNKDWKLEGMSEKEYIRFWQCFAEPFAQYDNSFVYRIAGKPHAAVAVLPELPGLQEPTFYALQKADFMGEKNKAYQLALDWTRQYPQVGEGWRQRSQVAQGIDEKDVSVSAHKAAEAGLMHEPEWYRAEQARIDEALNAYRAD